MVTPLIVADFMEAHFEDFELNDEKNYTLPPEKSERLAGLLRALFSQNGQVVSTKLHTVTPLAPGKHYQVSEQVLENKPGLLLMRKVGEEGMVPISVLEFINAFAGTRLPSQELDSQKSA